MTRTAGIFVLAGLLVGLGLALLVSPLASSAPDGLEKVAEEEGFAEAADPQLDAPRAGTAVAGPVGVLVTFGVGLALFGTVRVVRARAAASSGSPVATPPASP
jgi:hypothetical protein